MDPNSIKQRHGRDGWKDAVFIGVAVLLTALSIGSLSGHNAGKPTEHKWSVTVVESNLEINR